MSRLYAAAVLLGTLGAGLAAGIDAWASAAGPRGFAVPQVHSASRSLAVPAGPPCSVRSLEGRVLSICR